MKPYKERMLNKWWFRDDPELPRLRVVAVQYKGYTKTQLSFALVRLLRNERNTELNHVRREQYSNAKVKVLEERRDSLLKLVDTQSDKIQEQYESLDLKQAHIDTLLNRDVEDRMAQGFNHLNTLFEYHFTPKPTLWQRFKDWLNPADEDLDVVDLDRIL